MARYDVTPELASIIKSTRVSHNVTAKSVAEHLGKSQAFISKLEKGDLKTIEQSELISIFEFILGSQEEFQEFLNEKLATIISTSTLRHNKTEIQNQIWLLNFDTVLRLIPIPESLVEEINAILENHNISFSYLLERINGNEIILPILDNIDSYPDNTWVPIVEKGEIQETIIKMNLNLKDIEDILKRKRHSSNYVSVLAIVLYTLKIEKYGDNKNVSRSLNDEIRDQAIAFLNKHKFYSLEEKEYLESQAQNESEREELLSEFDKKNYKTINDIISVFRVYSDVDILRTTNYLSEFKKNLDWDGGFILRLISLSFYSLENTSVEQRKRILSSIIEILDNNKDAMNDNNSVEFYD